MLFHSLSLEYGPRRNLDIFVLHHIPNLRHFQPSELRPLEAQSKHCGSFSPVEENEDEPVVAELSSPNLLEPKLAYLPLQKVSLLSKWVLIYSYDFLVAEDRKSGVGDVLERAADHERSFESCPE